MCAIHLAREALPVDADQLSHARHDARRGTRGVPMALGATACEMSNSARGSRTMPPIISSSPAVKPKRRGRPRKHPSDAARKLAWHHRRKLKGEPSMQEDQQVIHD